MDSTDTTAGLGAVLVVDDDEVARNLIATHLGRMGASDIVQAADGQEAWELIAARRFDLIILDWKMPRMSGLAFFSRLRRQAENRLTPVLVVSGFLQRGDFRLLQEHPCTELVEKPFTNTLFRNQVEKLLAETQWYAQNAATIETLVNAVKGDPKKATQILRQVLKKAPNPVPLVVLGARHLAAAGLLKPAAAILSEVLAFDDGCVIAMSELGKVLHRQGQHAAALEVLRRASKLSPQNIERLCLMGEVHLNMQDPESARGYFEKALVVDGGDETAQAGMVIAGNMQELLGTADAAAVPRSFASLLNSMGIAFVRSGQHDRGIEQYRSAMAFLTEADQRSRVAFNLGLGFLRWGRPAEALPWFKESENLAPQGSGRSAAYVRRLLDHGAGDSAVHHEEESFDNRPGPDAVSGGEAEADSSNVIPFPIAAASAGKDDGDAADTDQEPDDLMQGSTFV